jgi:A/G-specific adenine glycosylase
LSAESFLSPREHAGFRRALLRWYDANKRPLPWRESRDPYRVWISEIMLQQTRVAAAVPYYKRFLARFPDVAVLAHARPATVLAAWSGLGYYRRARHLHQAARQIVHRGEFPRASSELLELPGIGRYTAAAIASIAFGERCAVVDGNVERVLVRVAGRKLSRKAAWNSAEELLSRTRPGDFNQALMELGATVCTPKSPQCAACPLVRCCRTRGEHRTIKPPPRLRRTLTYALARKDDGVLLVRRSGNAGVMAGMWELPEVSLSRKRRQPIVRVRHSIMNTDFEVLVFTWSSAAVPAGTWVRTSRLPRLALTGLARKILRVSGLLQ